MFMNSDELEAFLANPAAYVLEQQQSLLTAATNIGPATNFIIKLNWAYELENTCCKLRWFLKLADKYSASRLEAAAKRAVFYKLESINLIKLLLEERLDALPLTNEIDFFGDKSKQ
jgi:hypothetical protein